MKDNIIKEKDDQKYIGIRGFDYKLFEEEESGGVKEGLVGYTYLKHRIKLWPGDWVKQVANMNEAVGENNCLDKYRGRNQLVRHFTKNKLCKFIRYII